MKKSMTLKWSKYKLEIFFPLFHGQINKSSILIPWTCHVRTREKQLTQSILNGMFKRMTKIYFSIVRIITVWYRRQPTNINVIAIDPNGIVNCVRSIYLSIPNGFDTKRIKWDIRKASIFRYQSEKKTHSDAPYTQIGILSLAKSIQNCVAAHKNHHFISSHIRVINAEKKHPKQQIRICLSYLNINHDTCI